LLAIQALAEEPEVEVVEVPVEALLVVPVVAWLL